MTNLVFFFLVAAALILVLLRARVTAWVVDHWLQLAAVALALFIFAQLWKVAGWAS